MSPLKKGHMNFSLWHWRECETTKVQQHRSRLLCHNKKMLADWNCMQKLVGLNLECDNNCCEWTSVTQDNALKKSRDFVLPSPFISLYIFNRKEGLFFLILWHKYLFFYRLKFSPGGSPLDWFISSDMFYLEVMLESTGGAKDVRIHHEGKVEQQVSVSLIRFDLVAAKWSDRQLSLFQGENTASIL